MQKLDRISEAVAAQAELVGALGMMNTAVLLPSERLFRAAEYERAVARLQILREELVEATRTEDATLRRAAEILAYDPLMR